MLTKSDLFAAKDALHMAATTEEATQEYIERVLGVDFIDLTDVSREAIDASLPSLMLPMISGPEGMALAMMSIFQLGFTLALQARVNADDIPTA